MIAAKDGFIVSQSAVLDDGFADVNAGLKYNRYKNAETQTLLSAGLTYERAVGSHRAIQGNGDDEFHLFATGGTEFPPGWHDDTGSGFRLPVNRSGRNPMS